MSLITVLRSDAENGDVFLIFVLRMREVIFPEILNTPWIHHHGSVERGQAWNEIAAILNSFEESFFKVIPRSGLDRYSLLVKKI